MLLDRIFMKEIVCDSLNTHTHTHPFKRNYPGFFVYGNAGTRLSGGTPAIATPTFPHNSGGFLAGLGDQGVGLPTFLPYQELLLGAGCLSTRPLLPKMPRRSWSPTFRAGLNLWLLRPA